MALSLRSTLACTRSIPVISPASGNCLGASKNTTTPPSDLDNMMSSKDVIATRALKRPKLARENHLCEYCAQYTNICRSHKFDPNYCIREVERKEKFDD